MAVEIKLAPDEKLELVRAQITDATLNSNYFNVTELSDTFSGGKNAFLIAGSELLEPNTEVKVQIRDSVGKVLYCEFSDGSPDEYYEGISKVVAVYVYPTETAFGPATITLVGQTKDTLEIVKWQRTINIDPSLPNTTRVRFYKRPIVSIVEQLSPIYAFDTTGSKVASLVTQSFANIKVSQLDTFAGDVKRVKVYRTSEGDISDYDLIQDILVESKELLTTTALSGSVVGEAGLFTSETLKKLWNTGSLNAALTSSKIDNGLSLKGSGNSRYTSSLNLTNGNTYELGIDAFYSSSTTSNMGIYVSGSQNGAKLVGTLTGIVPTKNLKDQVFAFTLDKAEPTASLYLSQSQSEWHVGNISLKVSEDSAFSPSEISFVTSMPTVLGNETYNFKFEFYDVNNNYVPVAVTQSALFSGGNNNIGGTLILISGSTSASNASILALSQSVSGTIGTVTGSISQSFVTSSLYSASLQSSSLFISASVSGTISSVSQSASSSLSLVSRSLSSSIGALSSSQATTFSDVNSRIFTDASGLVNKAPSNTAAGLYLGQSYLGYHNGNGLVTGWKTYMANNGNFYLSGPGSDSLTWAGGVLTINGAINITGGNVQSALSNINATTSSLNSATSSLNSSVSNINSSITNINSATSSLDSRIFTTATGKINKTPSQGSTSGLYLGSTFLGYYNGSAWKTYMDDAGKFYLSGTGTNGLSWDGSSLSITGVIKVSDGTEVTNATITGAASGATALQSGQTGKSLGLTGGSVGGVTIASTKIYVGTGTYGNANTGFYVDSSGNMSLKDKLTWDGTTLSVKGVIQVSDGTEVTAATVSGAASGATALQSGQTGKSLGLTGGSVGGVTIASTKIYVGTGTHGNANTGFYVDSDGKMSLKDKLVWDGTTLSITGTVVITGGATKTAIDDAASAASSAASAASTAQSTADGKVAPSQVTNHLGGQNVTTIDGGKISALSFSGKTAIFDQGSVGGWTMDSTGLYKTTGAYTLRLGADAQRISIQQANAVDSIDRVRLDSSTDIPAITVSSTGSLYWSAAGQDLLTVYDTSNPNFTAINSGFNTPNGSPTHPAVSYVYGIIGLIYAAEEIWIESEAFPNIDNTIVGQSAFEYGSEVAGYYNATLRVRKFPTSTDALNETNADATYGDKQALVAYREFRHNQLDSDRNLDKSQIFGATMPADGPGGINTPAPGSPGNWYRVELRQLWQLQAVSPNPNGEAYIVARRPASDIFAKFGRVSNGYSVFSPGGLQVYQGVRNYMNASIPSGSTGDASNFFIVKGKSQIIGSLDVTSGLSANSKQFKIQHPINENKWLYHTSTESPRADLIYRGTLQLQSGVGSASIDAASNMTNGTFNVLTKNPQLFLQNNESFDRIKGYVQSGSVYVLSENQDSTASIDWSVIAERNDTEMLKSPLYDRNGKYKTENYKGEYLEATRSERFLNISGSI